MSDTRLLEQIGESYVVHELSRHEILTLKPFFDRDGADLVVLSDTTPSARIGVVQCKYRFITPDRGSSVSVPRKYIHDYFFLFLYVESSDQKYSLYFFCAEDIRLWGVSGDEYRISIPPEGEMNGFAPNSAFSSDHATEIKRRINRKENPLSFDAYVLGQNPVLHRTFQNWRDHGIVPSAQELLIVAEDTDIVAHGIIEKRAWMYAYSYRLYHELGLDTLKFSAYDLADASNSDVSLISADRVTGISSYVSGISNWHAVFPKYITADIDLHCSDAGKSVTGLYTFVRDSEGEGIEFFVPRDDTGVFLVRHVPQGARQYFMEVSQMLESRSEQAAAADG